MLIALTLIASTIVSIVLIVVMKPLLVRYALARPNARSSHLVPTPQGGGIAVMIAILGVTAAALAAIGASFGEFAIVAAALAAIGVVGGVDDIRPLPARPRLLLQIVCVAVVLSPAEFRVLPQGVPLMAERAFLLLGGVWFVNLVNFMDGLDWITVVEMVPIAAFIAALGLVGHLAPLPALMAAALCGALIGFAFFNKPVAKLFLGDVGSLPIGLLVGWLLLQLAGTGALAAAILLPLYYLADATITLLRRLARREKVWEAHRSHFYQQATANGLSVMAVSAHVFALNIALAALAAWTIRSPTPRVQVAGLVLGCILVGLLLRRFATKRAEPAS
jgi:UDP-N-acetylmuramyl pentapeptide phosphotransferase/UDP-N-acetylglucosamine-1-phosphate transferase